MKRYLLGIVSLVAVYVPTVVLAGTADEVLACSRIDAGSERLACFDAIARDLSLSAEERSERERANALEDFGLTQAQREERGNENAVVAEHDIEVVSTIASVNAVQYGPTQFRLENGQRWRTTSGSSLRRPLEPGMKVRIHKGAISGYRLQIDGVGGFAGVRRID